MPPRLLNSKIPSHKTQIYRPLTNHSEQNRTGIYTSSINALSYESAASVARNNTLLAQWIKELDQQFEASKPSAGRRLMYQIEKARLLPNSKEASIEYVVDRLPASKRAPDLSSIEFMPLPLTITPSPSGLIRHTFSLLPSPLIRSPGVQSTSIHRTHLPIQPST